MTKVLEVRVLPSVVKQRGGEMVNARTVDCISLLIKEVSEKVTGSNPVLTTVSLGSNPGRSTKSAPLVEFGRHARLRIWCRKV